MEKLTSILVVLDRSAEDLPFLAKACRLARQFAAHLELFACDAEHDYALRHAFDARGVEAARQASVSAMRNYLQALDKRIAAQNLTVSIDAVCESPLYDGIVHKVLRSRPDLVMKAAAREGSDGQSALGSNDWQLVRTCPAPLLLSRGRAWPAQPRFAALVDVSAEETPGLAAKILRTAEYLRTGCGADATDVLIGERSGVDQSDLEGHAATLHRLADGLPVNADRIRLLIGDPATTLTGMAAEQDYDLVVLGALTHRPQRPLVGTVTRQLMERLDCDFLLLRPGSFVSPVRGAKAGVAQTSMAP